MPETEYTAVCQKIFCRLNRSGILRKSDPASGAPIRRTRLRIGSVWAPGAIKLLHFSMTFFVLI